jgi:hypothetical protein
MAPIFNKPAKPNIYNREIIPEITENNINSTSLRVKYNNSRTYPNIDSRTSSGIIISFRMSSGI